MWPTLICLVQSELSVSAVSAEAEREVRGPEVKSLPAVAPKEQSYWTRWSEI